MLLNEKRAQAVMERQGVDALIATTPENVTYSSGFHGVGHWLLKGTQTYAILPRDSGARVLLVVPFSDLDIVADRPPGVKVEDLFAYGTFYLEQAEEKPTGEEFHRLASLARKEAYPSPAEALKAALVHAGLDAGVLAVDEVGLAVQVSESIAKLLPRAKIRHGSGLFREIRAVKTVEEVRRLRKAAEIAETAVQDVLAHAKEGVTEAELQQVFRESVVTNGGIPTLWAIGCGERSALPNVVFGSDRYRLRQGDVIRFDVGCTYQDYHSDIARIAVLGKPSPKLQAYHRALLAGEERAVESVRPGVTAAEIFRVAVETVQKAGIPHYRRHHCGHGIGIEIYDHPLIAPGNEAEIEAGMVFNIETPYYELGFAGVQPEDPVAVTAAGSEYLTTLQRWLIVL